jgi:hypothetical protein
MAVLGLLGQLYTEAPKLRRFLYNVSKRFTQKTANSLLSYIGYVLNAD